ncbi:MAG: adenylyltransferase/cytidyltransferase family protein, partial [Parcubacteria group bacterium]|nr:adenylyltransferase/cytidyltransferase family protein [Parcubacteria group bacterium]
MAIRGILEPHPNFSDRFIPDYGALAETTESLKRMGYRIVLTQGVYDLLHIGHRLYLEKAKSFGDILIVGVDSDDLTRARKGPRRPVVPQDERLQMLVGLRAVDIMTLRTPEHELPHLIKVVRPDTLVLSETTADFTPELVNSMGLRHYCGQIVTLPAQSTISTTARIRNVAVDGAQQLAARIEQIIKE